MFECVCVIATHMYVSACVGMNSVPNSQELKLGKVVTHQTDIDTSEQTWCPEKQEVVYFIFT